MDRDTDEAWRIFREPYHEDEPVVGCVPGSGLLTIRSAAGRIHGLDREQQAR